MLSLPKSDFPVALPYLCELPTALPAAQVHFVKTTGVYGKFLLDEEAAARQDPLEQFRQQLIAVMHAADDAAELTLRYSVFVILAKDPMPV